jgi:hypothetical protein
MGIVGSKIRKASKPKNFKEFIIQDLREEFFKMGDIFQKSSGNPVDQVTRSKTSFIPKGFERELSASRASVVSIRCRYFLSTHTCC